MYSYYLIQESKPIRTANEILELIAYVQKPPLNANADFSSWAKGQNVGLSLYIHTYFEYASSEYSGQSEHLRRFV